MSYLVIARKYRPLVFEDVIGQEHVTTTLVNAINNNKVHHAYLLTGPRGVGKTTISRIIAKALNCETGVTSKPCGVCNNCREIDAGNSLDVKEIDGASNRGIDEIRDLRDDIKFAPASCRKKIYIIDEVHMLTNQAFNALLKTLEEPPEHAVFIFATTEVNEVPATILSRCQRHDFRRVDNETLSKALKDICEKEGVSIDEESLMMITRAGDGSVRDSQSVLDQVIAFAGDNITSDLTYKALGLPALDLFFELTEIILSKDTGKLLEFIDDIYLKGLHILSFIKGLMEFYRDLLILKSSGNSKILDMTGENLKRLSAYVPSFGEKDLLVFIDILSASVQKLKTSPFQRMDFEIILLKILNHDPVTEIRDILRRFSLLEKGGETDISQVRRELGLDSAVQRTAPVPVKDLNEEKPLEIKTVVKTISENEPDKPQVSEKPVQKEKEQEPLPKASEPAADPEITLDIIKEKWVGFIDSVTASNPRLNILEYGTPHDFTRNNLVRIKFDRKHSIHMNLSDSKRPEITQQFNSFFNTSGISIEFFSGIVKQQDRIIRIETGEKKSFEEKKKELLDHAPQLEFLFEDPLNCKFID